MKSLTINVGDEQDDSYFLVTGLSEYRQMDDQVFRRCFRSFVLRLPPAERGSTRVTLRMFFQDAELALKLLAGGKALAELIPEAGRWQDVEVRLDATAAPLNEGLFELRGELSGDPFCPPTAEVGRVSHLVGLCRVTVSAEDGELAVPEWCRRARIEQPPRSISDIQAAARPFAAPEPNALKVFFGDLHVHTQYSPCGHPHNGTMEENLQFALDRGHDFIAFTDHGECLGAELWDEYFDRIEALAAGHPEIVILPGVEWTSRAHGHRNVYFRGKRPPPFSHLMFETNHPRKLPAFFARHSVDAFAVPHHMPYEYQPADIGTIMPDGEPLVEVVSGWGSSERHGAALQDANRVMPGATVEDALRRGFKLGFVGGGDAHNAAPGDSALAAVIAFSLDCDSLFEALRARSCYATSGPRILVDLTINGFPMGSAITVNQYTSDKLFPIRVRAEAVGQAALARLEVVANGAVIESQRGRSKTSHMVAEFSLGKLATRTRVNAFRQHQSGYDRYFYARATQSDGHMAWSSPIFIDYAPVWE